ncbi:hypothetical protein BDZ94DRAFT_1316031 [Collybia nuda]|uniref:Uncharacterized protein n=1 Tax=Collybia nuda TaxID=64659 RepID=A0A9P6C865_9AGAR|nr:hypothetical protein BDZ94DRAFT_1316031 [Collybia nuda]
MVRNEKRAKRCTEIEKREVDRLDRLPGPIPDAIRVIYRGNQTEQDNSFAGALSSSVYHSPCSNIVFAGDMAVAAATYELNNPQRTYAPLSGIKKLFSLVRNTYNHFEDRLEGYLIIEEFYRVSRAFVDTQRDQAMELVANNPSFHPHELPPMADENPHLLPTQPVPRDTSFRTAGKTSQKKGMGLSAPLAADTFNILEWARYIAIYHRPGNGKPIHGIAMNRAFHVELRSVFGYLLMKSMCPITPQARTAWTRQVACVVARPQAYREAVTVWESQHPEEQFSEVNPTSITLRRTDLTDVTAANALVETVFETMIRNHIPPSWVDHAYVWGMTYVNQLRAAGSLNDIPLNVTEVDRQRRLAIHGVPPPIDQWDGWYYPTAHDLTRIHAFLKMEENKNVMSLNHSDWLWIGESPLEPYYCRRQVTVASNQFLSAAAGSSTGPGTMDHVPSSDHNRDGDRASSSKYMGQGVQYNNLTSHPEPDQRELVDVDMTNIKTAHTASSA